MSTNGRVTALDADDVTWSNSTITAAYAVVYDADSGKLICLIDFDGEEESSDGDFTIEWHADGIFKLTVEQ